MDRHQQDTGVGTIVTNDTAPVASNDSYSVHKNVTLNIAAPGLLANDTNTPGTTLTAVQFTNPAHGTLTPDSNGGGGFSYTPSLGFTGTDSFTYKADDGILNSTSSATVMLTVSNDSPVANADSYNLFRNQTLTVTASSGVLANDSDFNGDSLTAVQFSTPLHGSLTSDANGDGGFVYVPQAGYVGTDSFTYKANDSTTNSVNAATVTITITDQAPMTQPDTYSTGHDQTLDVTSPVAGLLGNDSDPDGDTLTASAATTTPAHGHVTIHSDGTFTYVPDAHFTGVDTFTYTASDGILTSSPTVVTINVGDHAPVAVDDTYISVPHDRTFNGNTVLANDSDADGDPLAASLVNDASHGTVSMNPNGAFSYTPSSGYTGSDSFTYQVSDSLLTSNVATVSLTVVDPHAPVGVSDSYSVAQNDTLTVSAAQGVLTNDSDADSGDELSAVQFTNPGHGSLTADANGNGGFVYTPTNGYIGGDSFDYKASDGALTSAVTTVNINVTVNAPTATNDNYVNVPHDRAFLGSSVLSNDTAPNSDSLTAVVVSSTSHGTLQLHNDGTFSYTPTAGYVGSDSFTYKAHDIATGLDSSVATVDLTVVDPHVPVGVADSYSVAENGTLTVSAALGVLGNDSDADSDDTLTAVQFSNPGHGTLTPDANGDGGFVYTPNSGFSGADSFTYQAGDGASTSAATTVTISVSSVTPTLTLTIDRTAVSEAAGANAATATVTRSSGVGSDLVVTLASSDPSATVPATVTIPAGQNSAMFPIAAVDDGLVDGPHTSTLSASAAGFVTGTADLTVNESDVPTLQLFLDGTTVEEGGSVTGRVERNWVTGAPLAVTFSADTDGRVVLPVVFIAANQSSATFTMDTVNDTMPEKDETVTLTVAAGGFVSGTAPLLVTDHGDLPTLTLTPANTQAMENGAPVTFTVSRAVVVDSDLTVKLSSSDPNIAGPAADSVVIPAGQTSTTFQVNAVENHVVEGTQIVTITANGAYVPCGCTILSGAGTATLQVFDADAPALTLSADHTSALEGVTGAFQVTVTRNTSADADLVVNLTSSDSTELPAPATVTIPAGQMAATIALNTGSEAGSSGSVPVSLTATATNLAPASLDLTVISLNAPDLGVSNVTLPESGLIGQTASVSWTVSNMGRLPATEPWVERVYFAQNPTLDGTEPVAAELTIDQSLPAGASLTRSAPATLPAVPGTYYAIVVVDATNVLPELNTDNNQADSTATTDIQPTYSVTVATPTTIAPAGTPVQFTGKATLTGSTNPAANVPVTVRVIADGQFRRVLTATTDANGKYTATFTPLSSEASTYTVAAAHPAVIEDVIQAQFKLVGMQTDPADLSLRVSPGTPLTGTVTVNNLGSVPLGGLAVTVPGAPANVMLDTSLSSTSLTGNGSVTLGYTLSAADASVLLGHLQLHITSTEGAVADVPVDVQVVPLTPLLTSNPGSLLEGVVVGRQKVVSFDVANIGGAPSGPLQVQLPTDIPWLALASDATIPSLAPGEKTTVTLTLTPPSDTQLALFQGTINLVGANTQLNVGYQIRTVSTAVGDLQVSVQDEYTFFATGAPLVAGATVILRDDNTVIVAQGTTDASGRLTLSHVPEGTYVLDVSAPKHDPYRAPITVTAGILNQTQIFIRRQLVTYSWNVTAGQIQDSYHIQLQSVFETGVPAPVVVIKLPSTVPTLGPGQSVQVDAVIQNNGLIAANDVKISVNAPPGYVMTPLVTSLGTLPAMSEVTVPVVISRPAEGFAEQGLGDALQGCLPSANMDVTYFYLCGWVRAQ